jgi:hypothetical protein
MWALAISLGLCGPVESGEALSSEEALQAGREWTITLPLWIPGYRGQFAVGDIDVDGESGGGSGWGFLERLFDNKVKLNFAFMGAGAWERDRWRIHGDIFGGKFTDDVIFKLTDDTVVSASVQPIIPTVHAGYRVLQHSWGDSESEQIRVSVYGGVRYYDVTLEVDVLQRRQSLEDSWVDPILGVWVPVDLSRRWFIEVSGDLGGFDVGSKLSWHIFGAGSYRASRLLIFTLGYNILDVDYRNTIASQNFVYRVTVGGPVAGVRFNF